jgi:hypothetical protein
MFPPPISKLHIALVATDSIIPALFGKVGITGFRDIAE